MKPKPGEKGVEINVCEGMVIHLALGEGPPCLALVSPSWLKYGGFSCGNGSPDTDTGQSHSFRNPDLSVGGVSIQTGEFVTTATDVVAWDPAGPIAFTRTYRSNVRVEGGLGHRWFHEYDESLRTVPQSGCYPVRKRWVMSDGNGIDFFYDSEELKYTAGPEAPYQIRYAAGRWEIRGVDGTVRRFVPDDPDKATTLQEIDEGPRILRIYREEEGSERIRLITSQVDDIPGEVDRLTFHYTTVDGTDLLDTVSADGRDVTYTYSACKELATVTGPALKLVLGHTAEHGEQVVYTYTNPLGGGDCTQSDAVGHKLISIQKRSYDPRVGGTPTLTTVLTNAYALDFRDGNVGYNYGGVSRQYFRRTAPIGTPCPRGGSCEYRATPPDINYLVSWTTGVGRNVDVIDHRLKKRGIVGSDELQPDVTTRYEYEGNSKLLATIEDLGGLARRTEYRYDSQKLRNFVKRPDGRCTWYGYSNVAGSYLIATLREQSAAQCALNSYGPDDLVTTYEYADIRGVVRSVTRPEAYAPGVSPNDRYMYTTYYHYDFDQAKSGTEAAAMQAYCAEWNLQCPTAEPGLDNGVATDDNHWYGNLVRTRAWSGAGPNPWLESTQANQASGRPIKITKPDGVSEAYDYYTAPAPGDNGANWDWRREAAITPMGGSGPLAQVRAIPNGAGTQLTRKTAWNDRGEVAASRDAAGVRTELVRDADGSVLQELVCSPADTDDKCDASGDNVLNATRTIRDLWGRVVSSEVVDGAIALGGSGASLLRWTTYDVRGNVETTTIDPRTNLTPGTLKPERDPDPPPNPAPPRHLVSKSYYDGMNRLIASRSPEGRVSCFAYDHIGQLTSTKRMDVMADYGAEADCSISDANAVVTTTEYDKGGRVFRTGDAKPIPTYTYYWHDSFGRPAAVSDGQRPATSDAIAPTLDNPALLPANPSHWYEETKVNVAGQPIRRRFAGRPSPGAPSSPWLSASWTDYDHLRRPVHQYSAVTGDQVDGSLAGTTILSEAFVTGATGDNIAATKFEYQADGKLRYQYELGANRSWRRSEITYDTFGRVDVTYAPDPSDPTAGTSNRDHVDVDYDNRGLRTTVTRTYYAPLPAATPHTETASFGYDVWGRLTTTTGDPSGLQSVTTVSLDSFSRPTETRKRWVDADTADARDQVSTLYYDGAGRIDKTGQIQIGGTAEAVTDFGYDDDGLLVRLTDARSNVTDWTYSDTSASPRRGGLGRLLKMEYPLENAQRSVVTYDAYDKNGNPTQISNRETSSGSSPALQWTQQFDNYNRLTSRAASVLNVPGDEPAFYGTTSQTFEYDDRGLLVRALDTSSALTPADVIAEFTYAVGGMVTKEKQYFSDTPVGMEREVTSTYNREAFREQLGYPVSWSSSGSELDRYMLTLAQDGLGRLASITGPADSLEPALGVSRATTTLASYHWAGSKLWDRKFNQNGAQLRLYEGAEGSPTGMLVDALGRVTGMRTVDADGTGEPIVVDVRYGYDRVGNRTSEQRRHEPNVANFRTRGFVVDQAGRLMFAGEKNLPASGFSSDDPLGVAPPVMSNFTNAESWTLDALGNWSQKETKSSGVLVPETFTPNNLNQLTSVSKDGGQTFTNFTFDWLGQMRSNEDRDQKFVWDVLGRLTQVWRPGDPDGVLIAEYRYDALNRRVEKYVPGGIVATDTRARFIYDGWKIIEERAPGAGTQYEKIRARYGYGTGLSEVLWMDRNAPRTAGQLDPNGGFDPYEDIELRVYLHADALGSVIAVSDKQRSGGSIDVIERFDYSAYGRRTAFTGAWTCSGTDCSYTTSIQDGPSKASLPIGYTGHYWDRETGLWYARNRYYDDRQGRFISRDPLGYAGGQNFYGYASGAPGERADPLGLTSDQSKMQRWENLVDGMGNRRNREGKGSVPWGRRSSRQSDRERWESRHTSHYMVTGPEGCNGCESKGWQQIAVFFAAPDGGASDTAGFVAGQGHGGAVRDAAAADEALITGEYSEAYPSSPELVASTRSPDGSTLEWFSSGQAYRVDPKGTRSLYGGYQEFVEVVAKPLIEEIRVSIVGDFGRLGVTAPVLPVDYLDLERNFTRSWWGSGAKNGKVQLGARMPAPLSAAQFRARLKFAIAHESLEAALRAGGASQADSHAFATGIEMLGIGREEVLSDPAYLQLRTAEAARSFPVEVLGPIYLLSVAPELGIPDPRIPGGLQQ